MKSVHMSGTKVCIWRIYPNQPKPQNNYIQIGICTKNIASGQGDTKKIYLLKAET